jgi:hypothetical protein
LHVAQYQRAGGKFSQHFIKDSACLTAESEANLLIIKIKKTIDPFHYRRFWRPFEVTKVTGSCRLLDENRMKLILNLSIQLGVQHLR